MSEATEPNELLVEYLEKLPLTIRQSVYFVMGGLLSELLSTEFEQATDPEYTRTNVLRLLSRTERGGYALIGAVLSIASITDYLLRVQAESETPPNLAAHLEPKIGNQELAKSHSKVAWGQWRQLRATTLSEDAIIRFAERATTTREPEPPHRTVE
jgi:hypothetical protein